MTSYASQPGLQFHLALCRSYPSPLGVAGSDGCIWPFLLRDVFSYAGVTAKARL